MTSSFRLPPVEPRRAGGGNEFSAAVARLIERRGHVVVERPPVLPHVDATEEDFDAPARRWWPGTPAMRGALLALPVLGLALLLIFLLIGRPAPPPRPVLRASATSVTPAPVSPPAPSRPAVAAVVPPAAPDPAPPVAAAAPLPAPAAPPPSQPLAREEVREVQSRLTALGFAAGSADGVDGPQTQAALRRYAESRRLSGRDLDRALLLRLRAEPAQSR